MISQPTEFTCRGCSLLCDDIALAQGKKGQWESRQVCLKGETWINQGAEPSIPPDFEQAQQWVSAARNPLFCGLQGLTLEAESAAIQWAEKSCGYLALGLAPERIAAGQRYGGTGCTLGEVRHRADLLFCGNIDPCRSWPRLEERIFAPTGKFLPAGTVRTRLYLGEPLASAEAAHFDSVLMLAPAQLQEALPLLRRLILRKPPLKGAWSSSLNATERDRLTEMAEQLRTAAYPVLFTPGGGPLELHWTKLVQELNQQARLHRITVPPVSAHGSPSETLLALTGFPDALRFLSESTVHDLDRYQPERLLQRGCVDLVVFVAGCEVSARWEGFLRQLPEAMPVLLILERDVAIPKLTARALVLRAAVAGRETGGTCLRPDGVPVPLHPYLPESGPGLTEILLRLRNCRGGISRTVMEDYSS